jgi:hypothetical protein
MAETEQRKSYEDAIAHFRDKVPPEVLAVFVATMKVSAGELDVCPHCGAKITDMRQIERCVYGGCGCRLYQGSVPEKWERPLDNVQIRVPVEKMPWWERILYWIVTRF